MHWWDFSDKIDVAIKKCRDFLFVREHYTGCEHLRRHGFPFMLHSSSGIHCTYPLLLGLTVTGGICLRFSHVKERMTLIDYTQKVVLDKINIRAFC